MRDSGYVIVRTGVALLERHSRLVIPRLIQSGGATGALAEFWNVMAIDATRYRGMGREPLFPHVSLNWGTSDRQARMKLSELVGDGESDTVMAGSDEAEEVWRLLDSPAEWEIIGVSRTAFERSERTLGYDIGWWGGKFYSLISDCIVAPTGIRLSSTTTQRWPSGASSERPSSLRIS